MRSGLAVAACLVVLLAGCGGSSNPSSTPTTKPPVASAGGPYVGMAGTAVSFSGAGSSDPQGQTLTYAWNFGDSSTGTGVSPTHAYAAAGMYTVSLTVTNTSSLTATATRKATIAVAPLSDVALTGLVYGGATPIAGAHVYLFAANTTGYGGAGLALSSSNASVLLLSAAETGTSDAVGAYVATGSNGGFSLTGDYTCSSGQHLYLYALGGGNAAAGLMAAIGSCPASGSSAITVTVNEVSTIAAAYSFAGFATDATHVSSSGTALAQVGIANAFANAANLTGLSSGAALATTPAGNGTVPQTEINTLANILASCINTGTSCSTLLATATADGTATGTKPTDTATAAINIAHNPGVNIAALFGLATAVFTPKLSARPNDFTVALNFTGGGLNEPLSIAIDGSGNAWIANYNGASVIKLSSLGAALSGTSGFTGGGLLFPYSIAINGSGNAWITDRSPASVTDLSSAGAALSGANGYTGSGLVDPEAVAIDGSGNAWIVNANHLGGSVVELSNTGTALSGASGYSGGGLNESMGIAIDGSGNAWIANSFGNTVTKLTNAGSPVSGSPYKGGGLSYPSGIAIDASGNAWITNYDINSCDVTELSNTGSPSPGSPITGGGLSNHSGITIDGAGNVWINSSYNIVELSKTGSILSGAYGYADGELNMPSGIAIDGSGDIWSSNEGNNSVTELIGVGTPVITPIVAGLPATPSPDGSSKLGTRP